MRELFFQRGSHYEGLQKAENMRIITGTKSYMDTVLPDDMVLDYLRKTGKLKTVKKEKSEGCRGDRKKA